MYFQEFPICLRVRKIKINKQTPKPVLKQGFKCRDPSLKGNPGKRQQKREEGGSGKGGQEVKFQTTHALTLFKFKFKHLKSNEGRRLREIMWNKEQAAVFVGEA